jgi:hypothetical protein
MHSGGFAMKRAIAALALVLAPVGAAALAQDATPKSRYISPCTSWRYDSTVNGYVCSFYDSYVEIPDAYDQRELQRVIQELQRKVQDLEGRVASLEGQ